jgi:thioredoxin reductase (NADPH)
MSENGNDVEKVVIIGTGPAGLTAGIYTARANLNPLIFTGPMLGGQPSITGEVENFPGWPEGTTGPELVGRIQKQAERFGARIEFGEVVEVNFNTHPFVVKTYDEEYKANCVIVASGASARKLGVPGEMEFIGRGVSYCGTCDGFFFRDRDVVVVGGGDSALEEALFLTRFARKVRVIHRRDQLRAGVILQNRAHNNEKIEFVLNKQVTQINGKEAVESVTLEDTITGEETQLATDGVFIFIGHIPNTQVFDGALDMDASGHVIVDHRQHTNVEGVFAAGEVADPIFRQSITSAGDGAKAAIEADKFLAELEDRAYPGRK